MKSIDIIMRRLAIIPARGGSKRIPHKNIKEFLGKPILAYSIEAALESGLFNEVMVSTDDAIIAAAALHYGARVPFRRSGKNAGDHSSTIAVLKEVEKDYLTQEKQGFDVVCCIYPTAPLIKIESLVAGFELLMDEDFDSVFPVAKFSYPIWRAVEIENGKTKMIWPEHQESRTQDLPAAYHDAGQWYWYQSARITDSLFTENSGSIILPEEDVQDIDTSSDWALAELKYKLRTT